MLEYSLYVHLLGVALVLGVSALLDSAFHLELHLNELPSKQPHEFLSAYFIEGTLLFTLYPLYVVVASVLLGAYSIPHRAATGIVKGGGLLARGLGAIPYMGWIKPPSPDFPIEPIWYKAFHVATDGFTRSRPAVMVKMKRGDIYYGVLDSYPTSYPIHRGRRTSLLFKRSTLPPATRKSLIDWKICQEAGRSF